MSVKKAVGMILMIGGVALILVSFYIKGQVEEGNERISSAKQKVETADTLFSVTPETKQLGQTITNPANEQIKAGELEVSYYTRMYGKMQIGGIVLLIIGALVTFYPTKKYR